MLTLTLVFVVAVGVPDAGAVTPGEPAHRELFDAAGNRYDLGQFSGTVAFGPGPGGTLTAYGNFSVFVASYTSGGALRWVHRIASYQGGSYGGFAVTPGGSVVVTGSVVGATRISTPFGDRVLPAKGTIDAFLVRFVGNDGHIEFARSDSGPGTDQPGDVALDGFGNSYVTGLFTQTATFGDPPTATTITSAGYYDGFLASYTPGGALRWVTPIAAGAAMGSGEHVTIGGGTLYVSGSWFGRATVGSTSFIASPNGYDAFVARIDPSTGTAAWVRLIHRRNTTNGVAAVLSLAVAAGGDLLVEGQSVGPVGFSPPGYSPTIIFGADGPPALFEARYAGNGFLRSVVAAP